MTKISNFSAIKERNIATSIERLQSAWTENEGFQSLDCDQYRLGLDFADDYCQSINRSDLRGEAIREYQLAFEKSDKEKLSVIFKFLDDLITEQKKLELKAVKERIIKKAENQELDHLQRSEKGEKFKLDIRSEVLCQKFQERVVDNLLKGLFEVVRMAYSFAWPKLYPSTSLDEQAQRFEETVDNLEIDLTNKENIINSLFGTDEVRDLGYGLDRQDCIMPANCLQDLYKQEAISEQGPRPYTEPDFDLDENGFWESDGRKGFVGKLMKEPGSSQEVYCLYSDLGNRTYKRIKPEAVMKAALVYGQTIDDLLGAKMVGEFGSEIMLTDDDDPIDDTRIADILAPEEWQATGATELKLQS